MPCEQVSTGIAMLGCCGGGECRGLRTDFVKIGFPGLGYLTKNLYGKYRQTLIIAAFPGGYNGGAGGTMIVEQTIGPPYFLNSIEELPTFPFYIPPVVEIVNSEPTIGDFNTQFAFWVYNGTTHVYDSQPTDSGFKVNFINPFTLELQGTYELNLLDGQGGCDVDKIIEILGGMDIDSVDPGEIWTLNLDGDQVDQDPYPGTEGSAELSVTDEGVFNDSEDYADWATHEGLDAQYTPGSVSGIYHHGIMSKCRVAAVACIHYVGSLSSYYTKNIGDSTTNQTDGVEVAADPALFDCIDSPSSSASLWFAPFDGPTPSEAGCN